MNQTSNTLRGHLSSDRTSKKLSDFKALLFDIDRTLTNTKREISSETLDALKQLSEAGYQVGVCTGRGTAGIRNKILPLFPKDSLHITTGGSRLVDSSGKTAWGHSINKESIKNLIDYLETHKMIATFMKNDALYAKEPMLTGLKNNSWDYDVKNLSEMSNNEVGAVYIPNLNNEIIEFVENDKNLSKKHMSDNFGNLYIDVTAKGVNKAVTLQEWSKHTGIPTEKIIGFGDSLNDLEFIMACGFGVAMGNAVEELKQISDRVIGNVDDNGLAKYLLNIIQGENL